MLKTSCSSKERVSALQRKLYQKAKQQPEFRFYALYDKIYRNDVLQRSYDLVKRKGSSLFINDKNDIFSFIARPSDLFVTFGLESN